VNVVPARDTPPPLLSVEHLTVTVDDGGRRAAAVNDVSFSIRAGETLALVGESGCGKSLTALAILRVVPPGVRVTAGRIVFEGMDLLSASEEHMRQVRGGRIALVLQEPSAALNPVLTVGRHIAEALVVHGRASWREAQERAVELLASVSVPDAARRAHDYAHQLSGGLRQRVLIALALACGPVLLVADEPTTALDATIQAEILDLLHQLQFQRGLSLLLITHDLGVAAQSADRVAVMYAGRLVEEAPTRELFASPLHPYTQGLLASMPGGAARSRLRAIDGTVPSPGAVGPGCAFAPRCPARLPACDTVVPPVSTPAAERRVRCLLHAG
jgi:peptide/nickel transport system ATP-binding protein